MTVIYPLAVHQRLRFRSIHAPLNRRINEFLDITQLPPSLDSPRTVTLTIAPVIIRIVVIVIPPGTTIFFVTMAAATAAFMLVFAIAVALIVLFLYALSVQI
jgi:hypothetical protein